MARLNGAAAIVTGGSQGLGLAIARRLGAEGARVAIVARRQEPLDRAVAELRGRGAEAVGIAADVSDEADTRRYVDETMNAFGRVDVLVNNAGTIEISPLLDTTLETWERVFAVNTRAVFLGCRTVAARMIEQGDGGRIVNVASGAARRGGPLIAAYAASKFAVIGLTQSIAVELAPHDITVNACCPGHITTTPMWDRIDAETGRRTGIAPGATKAAAVAEVPLARSGEEGEVAGVVAFLASPDASFVTGESVIVDGGLLRY